MDHNSIVFKRDRPRKAVKNASEIRQDATGGALSRPGTTHSLSLCTQLDCSSWVLTALIFGGPGGTKSIGTLVLMILCKTRAGFGFVST